MLLLQIRLQFIVMQLPRAYWVYNYLVTGFTTQEEKNKELNGLKKQRPGIMSPGLSMMDQLMIEQRKMKENSSKRISHIPSIRSHVQEYQETNKQKDKSIQAKEAERHNLEKEMAALAKSCSE